MFKLSPFGAYTPILQRHQKVKTILQHAIGYIWDMILLTSCHRIYMGCDFISCHRDIYMGCDIPSSIFRDLLPQKRTISLMWLSVFPLPNSKKMAAGIVFFLHSWTNQINWVGEEPQIIGMKSECLNHFHYLGAPAMEPKSNFSFLSA